MLNVYTVRPDGPAGADAVNRLYAGVVRNLDEIPGRFVCFADDAVGIRDGIEVRPSLHENSVDGQFDDGDRVLFLATNVVFAGPIDDLATYNGPFTAHASYAVAAWRVGDDMRNPLPVDLAIPKRVCSFSQCRPFPPEGASAIVFDGKTKLEDCEVPWVKAMWNEGDGATFSPVMVSNVSDEIAAEQSRLSAERNLPRLKSKPAQDGTAVLVGGGPSLNDPISLWKLQEHRKSGASIWALNGTYRWLLERGIVPDAMVVLDARQSNVAFVQNAQAETVHYIASQCHPDVYNALRERKVIRYDLSIMGDCGTTVGTHAMCVAFTDGFRDFHLYGFDSSYRGDEGHAFAQMANDGDRPVDAHCGELVFKSAPWMVRQVADFKSLASDFIAAGCSITVHGDGLLPAVARNMTVDPAPGSVCYDLAAAPASWDFLPWLCIAEMDRRRRGISAPLRVAFSPGPLGGFRNDGLPVEIPMRQQILDHVMRPALALVGAVEDPSAIIGRGFDHMLHHVCDAARAGEEVPRFLAPQESLTAIDLWLQARGVVDPIVITLREASHWPQRNSNLDAWLKFANSRKREGRQIIFVRDTERAAEPIDGFLTAPEASFDLLTRAALYERSICNLFVSNGPIALGYFGGRPFLIFKPLSGEDYYPGTAEWWAEKVGVPVGTQYPWALPNQRIVWADDTLENIESAWADLNLE